MAGAKRPAGWTSWKAPWFPCSAVQGPFSTVFPSKTLGLLLGHSCLGAGGGRWHSHLGPHWACPSGALFQLPLDAWEGAFLCLGASVSSQCSTWPKVKVLNPLGGEGKPWLFSVNLTLRKDSSLWGEKSRGGECRLWGSGAGGRLSHRSEEEA